MMRSVIRLGYSVVGGGMIDVSYVLPSGGFAFQGGEEEFSQSSELLDL